MRPNDGGQSVATLSGLATYLGNDKLEKLILLFFSTSQQHYDDRLDA
jgi:hypothetical protein